ncbi:hypothetical protein B4U80_13298 [Leptotrombidium deliense]|uniref:Uncharacterized protein n=1 Tax=Leptotrombidium deliense TaxID=299467 RepID=A0A443S8J4_9ACAR|nr:hypothetical protein B4U80_13298 [Leptotrombidium deliense]
MFLSRLYIWNDLLKRFTDTSVDVRMHCVEIAEILMKTCNTYVIVTSMRNCLKITLSDRRFKIRIGTIVALEEISNEKVLNVCCPQLMQQLASRCGDTHTLVRQNALWSTANIFRKMSDNTAVKIIFLNHIFKLCSACLSCYKMTSDNNEMIVIENAFQMLFICFQEDNSKTIANNLLNVVTFCTENALKGMAAMLLFHKYVRDLLYTVLTRIESSCNLSTDKQLKTMLSKLEILLYTPTMERKDMPELIRHLLFKRIKEDESLFKDMLLICSEDYESVAEISTTLEKLRDQTMNTSFDDVVSRDVENDCRLVNNLILRCGFNMIDVELIIELITAMSDVKSIYCIRMASLITLLSVSFPQLFKVKEVNEAILNLPLNILIALYNDSVSFILRIDEQTKNRLREIIEEKVASRSPSPEY